VKKFFKLGLWRKFLAILMILAELGLLGFLLYALIYMGLQATDVIIIWVVFYAITAVTEFYIVFTQSESDFKIVWMLVVAALPVVGPVIYLLFANKRVVPRRKKKYVTMMKSLQLEATDEKTKARLEKKDEDGLRIASYIEGATGAGFYEETSVTYYPLGDLAFPAMLEDIKKARHYIFLEYFIIADGEMWGAIYDVLVKKALEGVDVRLIYDDVGNLGTLPPNFDKKMRAKGIKCFAYRPLKPVVDVRLNNRDHRKILVVDGHTAYTGGINLADEYINKKVRFGHWKDNAVRVFGRAAYSFTLMFLSTWKSAYERNFPIDFYLYSPAAHIDEAGGFPKSDGFVQPYGDVPFDYDAVGQSVYISILTRAKRYCYITTPYLIPDEELVDAIRLASLSGVDVRILTPAIPDKKSVFRLTQYNYGKLLASGVRIYEYTPGFVHAKMFVADDKWGTVGTINLDYRSLYLHMENGCLIMHSKCIAEMKEDFLETLKKSKEITLEDYKRLKRRHGFQWGLLRLISPLL
jgi:cardiolipin synthase